MKYLLTYNESINSNTLQSVLEKLGKTVDTKGLINLLKPHKDKLKKLREKYSTNGIIDARLIENDLKRFSFSSNESLSDNMITRFLGKLIQLPIDLVMSVYNFFKVIFQDMHIGFQTLIIAVMIFILSFSIYQIGEHAVNGISVGIVNSDIKFTPEHEETTTHYYTDSEGKEQSYTTTETIPDTWEMDVRAPNGSGRVETWKTLDHNTGVGTHKNDVVRIDSEWDWEFTKEYGEKSGGGGFSGGGTGQDY
jgi:hypothetical protein